MKLYEVGGGDRLNEKLADNVTKLFAVAGEHCKNSCPIGILRRCYQFQNGITTRKIEIYYNVIGKFEVPSTYVLPTASNLTEAKAMTAALGTPA